MSTQLIPEMSDSFMETVGWQEMYKFCSHWRSDLAFLKDELRFLSHLVDRYFPALVSKHEAELVQSISAQLIDLSSLRNSLELRTEKDLQEIMAFAELEKEGGKTEAPEFRRDHGELEKRLYDFRKSVFAIKREIFALTEHILEEDKASKLLTS